MDPIVKRIIKIPGSLSPVGEFYDIGVTPEVRIGYYDLTMPKTFASFVSDEVVDNAIQKYKQVYYSLPESYVTKRMLINAMIWKELTGKLPQYARDMIDEGFSNNNSLKYEFSKFKPGHLHPNRRLHSLLP
jgi:hypothetical protein